MNGNRSYARRALRMSAGQKRAYEQLYTRYCIPFSSSDGSFDWESSFQCLYTDSSHDNNALKNNTSMRKCRRRIIDIGFGMGEGLIELARIMPNTDFLGIEVYKPGIGKILARIEKENIQNVRVIEYDAVFVCKSMIEKESINGIHVFFPDPWPKTRHKKRRLIGPEFITLLSSLLLPWGYVYITTDWEDYAHSILADLSNSALENCYSGFSPSLAWKPMTRFEQKGIEKGHRIFSCMFQRTQ